MNQLISFASLQTASFSNSNTINYNSAFETHFLPQPLLTTKILKHFSVYKTYTV